MPEDYRKVVLDFYQEKKAEGKLSSNLLNPTPGSLREECLIVYKERYSSKDDEILRIFFNDTDKEKGYYNIINNSSAQKFKQMPKILKNKVPNPGIKFIELLAWLIDFNPRSSTVYYMNFNEDKLKIDTENANNDLVIGENIGNTIIENVIKDEVKKGVTENSSQDNFTEDKQEEIEKRQGLENKIETSSKKVNSTETIKTPSEIRDPIIPDKVPLWKRLIDSKVKKAVFSSMLIIITTCTGFYISTIIYPVEKCMYWTGDYYQEISCDEKRDGIEIIALDENKVNNFKKITKTDTISLNSIGKIWYSKIDNQVEFFTSKGKHPVYDDRILKPVTQHIIETYARK